MHVKIIYKVVRWLLYALKPYMIGFLEPAVTKCPKLDVLNQQKLTSSWLWRVEVQDEGIRMPAVSCSYVFS